MENGITSLFSFEEDYSCFSDKFTLAPSLQYSGEVLEFKADAELSAAYPENTVAFAMDELYLTYYNYGIWKAQIGRFHYLPGSSEFFSNTNYCSTPDYIKLIENQGKDYSLPGDMFQLSLIGSDMYIKNTFSITPVYSETVTADSPWLPSTLLPASVYVFSNGRYYRDSLYTENPDWPGITIENLSYNFETGYSAYWFDLSLQYYRGRDNILLNNLEIDLKENNFFDLSIKPTYEKKTAMGLNLSANLNALHFWFDGSYSFDKSFQSSTIDIPSYTTIIYEADLLETTAGTRYDFYWHDMTLFFEWKNSWNNSEERFLIPPYLSSALAGALRLNFSDYRQQPGAYLVYNLDDNSWISALQWKYYMNDNISFEATGAVLRGEDDTLFGHYEQDYLISLNIIYRK